MVRLRRAESFFYDGRFIKYQINYDHSAGSRHRYTVVAVDEFGAMEIIGRELTLNVIRPYIHELEEDLKLSRAKTLKRGFMPALKRVLDARLKNAWKR